MASTATFISAEDYLRLAEDHAGFRDELIEGEIVSSPLPQAPHTAVIENLEALLKEQFPLCHVVRESGWHIRDAGGKESVPGPDLMVLTVDDFERSLKQGEWFEGRPLVVIEVISPSERRYRRLQKIGLYLDAGAAAVVEVLLSKRILLVYRPESETPEEISERLSWPFAAEVSMIFARLLGETTQ